MLECLALIIYETNLVVRNISYVHSLFFLQQKEIKADIKQCMTDGLVLVRVSPQA